MNRGKRALANNCLAEDIVKFNRLYWKGVLPVCFQYTVTTLDMTGVCFMSGLGWMDEWKHVAQFFMQNAGSEKLYKKKSLLSFRLL